jgi:N-acyl homoserine lactone hydrolase
MAMLREQAAILSLAILASACDPTLAAAPPHAYVPPRIQAPPLQLCWVEYATNGLPGGYGVAGQSDEADWEITYSGLLVRHPRGSVLIDAGNSSRFSDELGPSGFFASIKQRLYPGAGDVVATAPRALQRVGEDPARLHAIVISHVHADHAGGLMDLPNVPVLVSQEELDFVNREKDAGNFDVVHAHGHAIAARARPIRFEAKPYATFDRSLDYFGDGSIVFVPLFGHTPGSIGTFVNRSPTQRFFHVGDAVNTVEAVKKRRGKSFIMEPTDHDSARADAAVAKLSQLRERDPGLVFLPAHDRAAWKRAFGSSGCLGSMLR